MSHQLILAGGREEDRQGLVEAIAACGRDDQVLFVPSGQPDEVVQALSGATSCCLLVDLDTAVLDVGQWLELLHERRRGTPLFVVAAPGQEVLASEWLAAGAESWFFRPRFSGLGPSLARHERDLEVEADERRLREATALLVQLARSPRFRGDDLPAALREVTEAGARGLRVARCGVWLCDELRTVLREADSFIVSPDGTGEHQAGLELSLTHHQAYFEALSRARLMPVTWAQTDPRTQDFAKAYFTPNGITSTLDVAVRLRGELVGTLGLESVGEARRWTPAEEVFAGALADVVSLALEGAERFRAESALLESQRRFRDLFHYSSDCAVLYRVSLDGSVYCEDLNPATEAATGLTREQAIGRQAHEVLAPGTADKLVARYRQAIAARQPITFEQELAFPAGTRQLSTALIPLLDEQGRVHRLASVSRDVTLAREAGALQRRLELQLAEAQKSEALGRLASHIAHDVNNLLTVIVAHASRLDGDERTRDVANAILQATSRGRELTQQVLTFGRRRPPERRPIDLAPLVREAVKLLQPTAPHVTVTEHLDAGRAPVLGDAAQLHQVITNICSNALQAMPGQGTLEVRLEEVTVDGAFAAQRAPLGAGRAVRLTVSDTGDGMDEATRQRIFEPFFTTREAGRGTGLGLTVVQGIVAAHDGAVVVESEPGRGTRFQVYLPALTTEEPRAASGQHLLLVDDHPGMARVAAKLLEAYGYRTSVFDDPRHALAAFTEAPSAFDAVLTDLSMPQMSGVELARALRALRPTLPVIVSSGRANELSDDELRQLGVSAVLVKPWRLEEAVATLQRLLS